MMDPEKKGERSILCNDKNAGRRQSIEDPRLSPIHMEALSWMLISKEEQRSQDTTKMPKAQDLGREWLSTAMSNGRLILPVGPM